MSKHLSAVFVMLFLSPVVIFAGERDSTIAKEMTKVQELKADAATWEGRNSQYPYVALLNEYETRIEPDWSFTENYHVRIKVQQDSAKELGEWPIYYNKSREQVVDIKAFVELPEGKKVPAASVKDLDAYEGSALYSDMKVKLITLPQVGVGSIIDVTVKTKSSSKEMPGQFWDEVPYPVIPTKYARHTFIFPEDKPIEFKAHNDEHKPLIEKKNGTVKFSFVFEETAYTESEELMPPPDQVKGGMYLSSIKDWQAVADWFRELVLKNSVDDNEIAAKAQAVAKDKPTQKEKVRAILEFIQDDFRYVAMNFGDHTVDPHPTVDVFRGRSGDSKDIAILVRQMLKTVGIDSNICLMNSEFSGDPQVGLPNPTVFEHVILEMEADGEKYFVDPQAKGFELGQFPPAYDHAYVLVIDGGGWRFDHLPALSETQGRTVTSESDITLKEDGSAVFVLHVTLPLETSQGFRSQWQATTTENRDKFFESLESNFTQGGNMLSHEVKGLEDRYGPVSFNLKYEAPGAYQVINDMILLKEADQSDVPDFAAPERKYPIFMPANSLIVNTNTYHIPKGYVVDFLPTEYDLATDFAQVGARYATKDNTVTVHSVYRMKRASMPPARYKEVQAFREELYKKNEQYVVLKKKPQASQKAKEWIKNQ